MDNLLFINTKLNKEVIYMALTTEELAKVQAMKDKAEELQALVRESLSIQNVGGSHIANELTKVIKNAKDLGAV